MSPRDVSVDLLRALQRAGPALHLLSDRPVWKENFGAPDYEAILDESAAAASPLPLSLYFHLPFCERLCYFCGCTVVITGSRARSRVRLPRPPRARDRLGRRRAGRRGRPVVQLHWGGGTPTYFPPPLLERLAQRILERFAFAPDAEIGVEVDPRVTTRAHLETLARLGFNRLSMGVQDFDPRVQEAINRIQPEATRRLVEQARALGFPSVNMDLIYGLPFQTPESFSTTIDRVLEIGPDRLAVYSYANVPWMKKHQNVLVPDLPDEATKFDIFRTALARFTAAGFEYIGMDHFARPDDELARARRDRTLHRNFQGYTTKAGTDLIGFGMSAIGSVGDHYVQNRRELPAYRAAVAADGAATFRGIRLTADDRLRRTVIGNLLCHGVIVKSEIERQFGIAFDTHFADALQKLEACEADGLVELTPESVRATELGRVFLRNLAMPFDAYLEAAPEKPVYSRTL